LVDLKVSEPLAARDAYHVAREIVATVSIPLATLKQALEAGGTVLAAVDRQRAKTAADKLRELGGVPVVSPASTAGVSASHPGRRSRRAALIGVVMLVAVTVLLVARGNHLEPSRQAPAPSQLMRVGGADGADFFVIKTAHQGLQKINALSGGGELEAELKRYCESLRKNKCLLFVWADPEKVQRAWPIEYRIDEGSRVDYTQNGPSAPACYRLVFNGLIVESSPNCPDR
jgi:hypothetical protein